MGKIKRFYEKHPILFIHLSAIVFWWAFLIVGGVLLALLFGRNQWEEAERQMIISAFMIGMGIWTAKCSIRAFKRNRAGGKTVKAVGWAIYAAFYAFIAICGLVGGLPYIGPLFKLYFG